MKEIAPNVWQLKGFPPDAINVYVAGDVLIDAATKRARKRIFKQLEGRTITEHALTHAHADHQGCSKYVCDELGIPLACPELDVEYMETDKDYVRESGAPNMINKLQSKYWRGPPRKVDRTLREGDMVGDFKVFNAPGHTPGHVFYFRESDRVAITGDICSTISIFTGLPGIHEAPKFFAADRKQNHESLIKLYEMNPSIICPGHGKPLRDMRKLERYLEKTA